MNNMQFYFALGVPFFTLLIVYFTSVVSNRAAINDLRGEMHKGLSDLRAEMRSGFADMRADIGSRLERIEKKQDALDTEIRIGHDHRIAVLEARVLHQAS